MISRAVRPLVAASFILLSSAATAQSAQPLDLAAAPEVRRVGAEASGGGDLRGRVHTYALGLALIAILVFVLVEATDNDEETEPVSP